MLVVDNPLFLVPEKGESMEQSLIPGFVGLATLTLDGIRQTPAISLALRNRFVSIAVENPTMTSDLKQQIAVTTTAKFSERCPPSDWSILPPWTKPLPANAQTAGELARTVAVQVHEKSTVRDVALLAQASASVVGIVVGLALDSHVKTCQFDKDCLTTDAVADLIHQTIEEGPRQRFFYKGDRKAPMWQSIAALTVGSLTGTPLFFQGAPGCGKTEAVRSLSNNRPFGAQSPVYSVSCSAETAIEQFIGNLVFEKDGFRFIEGPLVQAARDGFLFLADEFNLLTLSVMIALISFLEARAGDEFFHPDVKGKIRITPRFACVATGNEDSERGRIPLPVFVLSQFRRLEVANPAPQHMDTLIEQIIDGNYPSVKRFGIVSANIRKFIDQLKETLHVTWSLRSVRRFLRRVHDCVGYRPEE
jgi:cobaltochelatase CobS